MIKKNFSINKEKKKNKIKSLKSIEEDKLNKILLDNYNNLKEVFLDLQKQNIVSIENDDIIISIIDMNKCNIDLKCSFRFSMLDSSYKPYEVGDIVKFKRFSGYIGKNQECIILDKPPLFNEEELKNEFELNGWWALSYIGNFCMAGFRKYKRKIEKTYIDEDFNDVSALVPISKSRYKKLNIYSEMIKSKKCDPEYIWYIMFPEWKEE
jgi:hypothetical protein